MSTGVSEYAEEGVSGGAEGEEKRKSPDSFAEHRSHDPKTGPELKSQCPAN